MAELHVGSELPDRLDRMAGRRSSAWWGALWGAVVVVAVLGYLVYSYFYLYVTAPEGAWPPPGVDRPPLALPAAAALAAAVSAVPLRWVNRGWDDRDPVGLRRGILATAALGVVVLAVAGAAAAAFDVGDVTAYRSIVWVLHAYAALLTVVGIVMAGVAAYQATTFESPSWVWSTGAVFEVWWATVVLSWFAVLAVTAVWPQLV
jgi:cytochrome c oxidase subunit III